jgi:hypothetical protein
MIQSLCERKLSESATIKKGEKKMVDENIYCRKRDCKDPKCELHHYVPRGIGGTDKDGRVYLCKKHHDILHKMIISQVWRFVPEDKREGCREFIEDFGRWWVTQ